MAAHKPSTPRLCLRRPRCVPKSTPLAPLSHHSLLGKVPRPFGRTLSFYPNERDLSRNQEPSKNPAWPSRPARDSVPVLACPAEVRRTRVSIPHPHPLVKPQHPPVSDEYFALKVRFYSRDAFKILTGGY